MAADPFANLFDDFDRWDDPSTDGSDVPWYVAADRRAARRRQLRRYQAGFNGLSFALVVASLFNVGMLLGLFLAIFFRFNQLWMALRIWDFGVETTVVFASFLGVCLLWGLWPDERWGRRSGLLLMMCLTDLVLWSLDHATRLGLADAPIAHEYFREALGRTLGWCQYALILSLAMELATTLGETRATEFGQAVRSLITVGASVWIVFFYLNTDWRPPVWPLRAVPMRQSSFLITLGYYLLATVVQFQVMLASMIAGRTCGAAVRALDAEDRADEPFLSPSDAAWDDLRRRDHDHR